MDELAAFKLKLDDYHAERTAEAQARQGRRVSEGQWFYENGLRLKQQGQEAEAREVWGMLVEAYGQVPSEKPWVRRAERELEGKTRSRDEKPWASLREALKRVRALEEKGEHDEAASIRGALEELYHNNPAALALIRGE